ncbi:MAG TPA: lmo0937 family membrane protein, partial [Methylomirabilota bacterium]|nr:lmo0937 family membrane protein [Methylomirabilota bacterium]
RDAYRHERRIPMLLIVAIVLAVLWAFGWFAFHVASGLIHLLLLVAVISLIIHFIRGGAARA